LGLFQRKRNIYYDFFYIFVRIHGSLTLITDKMKRVFLILLTAATIIGMASCKKNTNPTKPTSTDASEEPEAALVEIDGNFSEWATLKDVVTASVSEDEEAYPYLLTMKAVADKTYIYFYFEYLIAEDQTKAPINILIDADNDPTTGFTSFLFKECGWEYSFESSDGFLNGSKFKGMNTSMNLVKCEGPDGADRWATNSKTKNLSGGCKSKGEVSNGIVTFELSVKREKMDLDKPCTIAVGAYTTNVVDENWNENGVLPREDAVADVFMEVKLP